MPDREKVIKGLECCEGNGCAGAECPYFAYDLCGSLLAKDALELLKEQEEQIERLEYDLAITKDNLNYYINGNN